MLNRLRAYLAVDVDFKPLFDRIYPFNYWQSEVRMAEINVAHRAIQGL